MTRQRILYSAFAGMSVMGFLSIPTQFIERHLAPEPAPIEGNYLPRPGNRTCPEEWRGRVYAGYVSGQSDSIKAPVTTRCIYRSKEAMRGMA